ncbi:MAG TPA: hypothetical protein DCY91_17850, partial [Cyanobacteria bacterium UBA11370]|nr:hypothetical protein [Cyanobacteria bacterium UBA11370]
ECFECQRGEKLFPSSSWQFVKIFNGVEVRCSISSNIELISRLLNRENQGMSGSEYVEKKSSFVPNQTHSELQPQRSYQPEPIFQETASIEEQLDRTSKFGYNGLDVPVNAPATPPPPVQRQLDSRGSENNSQPQAIPEASATSETVEEIVQREELVLEEVPPNQESPDTEGEGEGVAQTVQPEAQSGEQQPQKPFLPSQLEKASRFGYNGLDVPVNTPGTPSPIVQRKLTLDGLDNEYQPEVIERANPVLNGLHQFKVQRLVDAESKKSKGKISKEQKERINTAIAEIRKLVSEKYVESQFNALEGNLPEIIGECFKRHGHVLTFLLFGAARTCGENGLVTVDCFLSLGALAGGLVAYYFCIKDRLDAEQVQVEAVKTYLDRILYLHDELIRIQEEL